MIEVPSWICYTIAIIFCLIMMLFIYCCCVVSSRCDKYELHYKDLEEDEND